MSTLLKVTARGSPAKERTPGNRKTVEKDKIPEPPFSLFPPLFPERSRCLTPLQPLSFFGCDCVSCVSILLAEERGAAASGKMKRKPASQRLFFLFVSRLSIAGRFLPSSPHLFLGKESTSSTRFRNASRCYPICCRFYC